MATTYTSRQHFGKQEDHEDKLNMSVITNNADITEDCLNAALYQKSQTGAGINITDNAGVTVRITNDNVAAATAIIDGIDVSIPAGSTIDYPAAGSGVTIGNHVVIAASADVTVDWFISANDMADNLKIPAANIPYDNTASGLAANNAQAAIDALNLKKTDKVSGAVAGNLAGLNSGGSITDSGIAPKNIVWRFEFDIPAISSKTITLPSDAASVYRLATSSRHTSTLDSDHVLYGGNGTTTPARIRTGHLGSNVAITVSGNVVTLTNNNTGNGMFCAIERTLGSANAVIT